MGLFSIVRARVKALRDPAKPSSIWINRLDDWRPELHAERLDIQAIWQEAISPVHPILDECIRIRLEVGDTGDRYACRNELMKNQLAALGHRERARVLAETFRRLPFVDHVAIALARAALRGAPAEAGGLDRHGVSALTDDLNGLATELLRLNPRLDATEIVVIARAVALLAENVNRLRDQPWFRHLQSCLCNPANSYGSVERQAFRDLLDRLAQMADPFYATYSDPPSWHADFVTSLATSAGVSAEAHPIVKTWRDRVALITQTKQTLVVVAGPFIGPFIRRWLGKPGPYWGSRERFNSAAKESGLDELSPEERAKAIFDCLRVKNFLSHCGEKEEPMKWPRAKRAAFNPAPYPRIREYGRQDMTENLSGLIRYLASSNVKFDSEMLIELIYLMRCDGSSLLLSKLRIAQIIEKGFMKNPSVELAYELGLTIEWLKPKRNNRAGSFAEAAVIRFERALNSVDSCFKRQGFDALKPEANVACKADRVTVLPPPVTSPVIHDFPRRLIEFYGDLADLRKCTSEHLAAFDDWMARDAEPTSDIADKYKDIITAKREGGASEDEIRTLLDNLLRSRYRADRHGSLLELLMGRVKAVGGIPERARNIWPDFCAHSRILYGKSKPSAAWLKTAETILAPLNEEDRVQFLTSLLSNFPAGYTYMPVTDAVRGLLYSSGNLPPEMVAGALADFAQKKCFQTVAGAGIASQALGNACLRMLIQMPDGKGIPYLGRLLNRIKYPSIKKIINQALDEAAEIAGVTRGVLDEITVPTHDLTDGHREIAIGPEGGAAVVKITGSAKVEFTFRRADGKTSSAVPAELKQHKAEIKEARAAAKEIEADLASQLVRLQRLWLERRDWVFEDWQTRYARHPLIAGLVSRLIWLVDDGKHKCGAVFRDGELEDIEGRPIQANGARIALWHPIGRPIDEVLAWRKRLSSLGIVQPFKQAHREVYIVTAAERTTGTYSNRFAGHILRQHQMMTLARLNGWMVTHRIWADVKNDEPTHLAIPAFDLVADFWTAGAGGENPEVTASQAYTYLSTDQVRFHRVADGAGRAGLGTAFGPPRGEAMRMEDVPTIVFSEVMRHCDLFTSVASVAADPEWLDAGSDAAHPNAWRRDVANPYWHRTSFGQLQQSGSARKDALETLLPAFGRGRCRIDGNFLCVEGKLRSYRIHVGSGNILMEPDERYLCIVPARNKMEDRIMLPFEGDGMLSVVISKALLLLDDDKITDPAITQQLR
jgi:hypothetical protein